MSTVQEVIRSSYRRSNIVAAGVTLNAVLSNIGIERLQGMYLKWLGDGLFGPLTDYFADDDYEAKEFERVFNSAGNTITIPATITDEDTGAERAPIDGAVIVVIDASVTPRTVSIQIYDAHYGWSEVNGLTMSSYAPLSGRYEEHLKNVFAMELLSEFPVDGMPTPLQTRLAQMARLSIASGYNRGATRPRPKGVFY